MSKLILLLNVFRIIQTLCSGDPVTVEVFILVDRALTDLGVAGGASRGAAPAPMHTCAGPKVKTPSGEVSQQEVNVLIQRIQTAPPQTQVLPGAVTGHR